MMEIFLHEKETILSLGCVVRLNKMRDGQNVVVLFGVIGVLPKLILIGIVIGNMTIGFNFGRFYFPLVFILKT